MGSSAHRMPKQGQRLGSHTSTLIPCGRGPIYRTSWFQKHLLSHFRCCRGLRWRKGVGGWTGFLCR